MMSVRWVLATAMFLSVAACASGPVRFYTLVTPGGEPATPSGASGGHALAFELSAVRIPAQVDQPQLVVREGDQRLAVLEADRWVAPLGDEVRAALAAALARDLPGEDLSGLAGAEPSVFRIRVELRRFDSAPGAYALIEATWSLRAPLVNPTPASPTPASPTSLVCTTTISEPVGPGYDALVQGHQRALGRLAEEIAAAARTIAAGGAAACR